MKVEIEKDKLKSIREALILCESKLIEEAKKEKMRIGIVSYNTGMLGKLIQDNLKEVRKILFEAPQQSKGEDNKCVNIKIQQDSLKKKGVKRLTKRRTKPKDIGTD